VVVDEATSTLDARARATILDVLIRCSKSSVVSVSLHIPRHDGSRANQSTASRSCTLAGSSRRPKDESLRTSSTRIVAHCLSAVLFPDPTRKLEPFYLAGEIPSDQPQAGVSAGRTLPLCSTECRSGVPPLVELMKDHKSACLRSHEWLDGGVPRQGQAAYNRCPPGLRSFAQLPPFSFGAAAHITKARGRPVDGLKSGR